MAPDDGDDVTVPDVPTPARTTTYGPDPAQVYDVRLPTASPLSATVVIVHGGFWRARWDRDHAAAQAQAFADAGYHVAVLEYRRTGMAGGGWPGTFLDVAAAIATVRADPTLPGPCVLVGHSAGGHLAALAASQPWAPGLGGAVSLAGVVDLRLAHMLHLGAGAVEAFLGRAPATTPDEPLSAADPAMRRPMVPVVLIHGADDDVVPADVSRSYLARVEQVDGSRAAVVMHIIPDGRHFDLIDPRHGAFRIVLEAVATLVAD